jgi:hypothetical protein
MGRFIVRFRSEAKTRKIAERLQASPAIKVIDETPRMILVEASEAELRQIVDDDAGAIIVPERHYEPPNPPLKVRKE